MVTLSLSRKQTRTNRYDTRIASMEFYGTHMQPYNHSLIRNSLYKSLFGRRQHTQKEHLTLPLIVIMLMLKEMAVECDIDSNRYYIADNSFLSVCGMFVHSWTCNSPLVH